MRVTSNEVNEALLFVSALADGVNPITEEEAESRDTLNHPAVIRKMYAVKNVLETMLDMVTQDEKWEQSEVYARCREFACTDAAVHAGASAMSCENTSPDSGVCILNASDKDTLPALNTDTIETGSRPAKKSRSKSVSNTVYDIPGEVLEQFSYDRPKTITALLDQIYAPMEEVFGKKLSALHVNKWLVETGFMEERYNEELGRKVKAPTALGEEAGIHGEIKISFHNGQKYMAVSYTREGQRFIIANIEHIINGEAAEYSSSASMGSSDYPSSANAPCSVEAC